MNIPSIARANMWPELRPFPYVSTMFGLRLAYSLFQKVKRHFRLVSCWKQPLPGVNMTYEVNISGFSDLYIRLGHNEPTRPSATTSCGLNTCIKLKLKFGT